MYNIGKYRKERVKFMSCTYGQLKYKPEFLSFCLLPKWLDPTAASQHVIPSISSPWLTDPLIRVIWVASTSASALMICCATASTMGITMAAVEVLLSHMDKKAGTAHEPQCQPEMRGPLIRAALSSLTALYYLTVQNAVCKLGIFSKHT